MIDLGLSAGKPVWFCVSLSHAVNRELEHAEPICLDTSSWQLQEGAGDVPGQRRWEHPAAEGLSPLPAPALLLPPPCCPPALGSGCCRGIPCPFDGTLLPLVGFLELPKPPPPVTLGECPTSVSPCCSSTNVPPATCSHQS